MQQPMQQMMGGPQTIVVQTDSLQKTMDPKLQCHFADCFNIGTETCTWQNAPCRSKGAGGCQKRYCKNHQYVKTQII